MPTDLAKEQDWLLHRRGPVGQLSTVWGAGSNPDWKGLILLSNDPIIGIESSGCLILRSVKEEKSP